ncbi:MAG: flagellar M-ring protein FliF [Nitrospirae bacterium]|nr:flagellar M-ring protein FliF [Nitrospirota bacterium]MBI3351829.1 flagellar M-ring protein FliF [Nitrospirota bacterium]
MEQIIRNLIAMPLARKLGIVTFLVAMGSVIVVLWLWAQKPDFEVLYSNLASEDAGVIINKLKEAHIPYSFSPDGSAVLVPSDRVHEMRIQLASQGIPQGGIIGFEIFDRSSLGTTEFVQKINYRRALEGELDRTIGQLSEVSKARVHLAVPEKTLFSEHQEHARASIVVTLRPGKTLNEAQIQGVVHLVASSVEDLSPQAVTVVDNHGHILSKNADTSSNTRLSSSQLDYQHATDKKIEENIQTMLEKIVGPNKAIVRVTSLLDFRQVETTEEKFDPDSQTVRSEQRSEEKNSGSTNNPGPAGVPGVLSNVPPKAESKAGESQGSQNSGQKKNDLINYEISKTVSRIIEPTGTLKRLSVAVLVDGMYEPVKGEKGETTYKYLPRSEEDMKKLDELVKKAVGYSEERKDQVEVVNIPFESNNATVQEEAVEKEGAGSKLTPWLPFARYGIMAVLSLIIWMFVIRPLLKTLTAPSPMTLPALHETRAGSIEEYAKTGLNSRDQMIQLTKENPQAGANVVRKWLKEK